MIDKTQRLYESLDSFLTEYKEKNEGNKYRPVAVGRYGIRTRESIYSKELAKDYSKNKLIFKNTLTVGMGSTQIDIGVLSDDATYAVSPAYHTYRINGINSDYLRYCLECRNQDMFVRYVKRGSRQGKSIDLKRWITYKIPVYPESVQAEIVKRLDSVKAILSFREQELNALDELIKARFVEMFGDLANPECKWKKCLLVDVCLNKNDIKCGPFGTQLSKDEYTTEGIAVWEIPQINMGFQCEPTHFLTEEKANQLEAYSLIPGDIAMSRKGNVGKCALFPEEYSSGIIHSDVLRIRVDKKNVNPVFMMYQLHFSQAVTRQIELVSSGAIMAGVNVTKLKQIYVHVPPIYLQNQFAAFVSQIDKSKLLSGCRFFHSWAPANLDNLNRVGVSRQKTKGLRGD